MAQIVEHEDGVYLNLKEENYYADWAIGGTSLSTLKSSPPDWWWESPFNTLVPDKVTKDEDATKAMLFGSAVHCALLEGMDVFNLVYGAMPDKYSHRNALAKGDDFKKWLKEKGEKVSGSNQELIDRILGIDATVPILDVIQDEWLKQGKKPLSRIDFNKIHLMERVLMGPYDQETRKRNLSALGKAFQGGLSEVSVFWTDDQGIRQRARFDKLKPNATIDLKTYSNWKTRDFGKAMLRDAALKGHHIQAAHYEEARNQLRRLVGEGRVFFSKPVDAEMKAEISRQIELLKEIAAAETWRWVWVYYKTDGSPRAKGVIMDWKKTHAQIYAEGCGVRAEALANFLHYRSFFDLGQDKPMWVDPETIWAPAIEDWPTYAMVAD